MSDSRELEHAGPGSAVAMQPASDSANIVAMILEAARDPSIDAGKVETMATLAMRMQDREREAQFNRDLNAAITEMPVISKAGIITINDKDGNFVRNQGRFARFEDIDRVVRPILHRHNLALRFDVGEKEQQITVQPILSHANGHTERGGTMRLPLETSGSKNNVQGAGSTVSYGKRYTMCALLNIITEGADDDGSLGKFSVEMPHEREITVLEDAEQAAAEGRYPEWFARQGIKDRAWLISSQHHVRLGGELVALPGNAAPQQATSSAAPEGAGAREKPAAQQKQTAEEWTVEYERDCQQAADLEALSAIKRKGDRALDKLRTNNPTLYDRADKAFENARVRLSGGDA